MRSYIFFLLLLMTHILPPNGIGQITQDSLKNYMLSLENYRNGKNIKLMYSESTPLKPEQQKDFKGLNYFPGDIKYQLQARLTKYPEQEVVIMKTSGDRLPEYIVYGEVTFTMDGLNLTLKAYQSKKLLIVKNEDPSLFIPFRDATSGKETYGGGRYVDCQIPSEGQMVILDFNKAYNPYCAYNEKYSCVLPPEENRLSIRIEAGEKIFEKH